MRPSSALALALVLLVAACKSDDPSSPQPVAEGPGPVVVEPGSNLALSADSICFQVNFGGAPARSDDVRITSLTGSEIPDLTVVIAYGPGQPTGWLLASLDRSTTPARLWLYSVTGSELTPPGDWWADVTVSAPTAGVPRVVRVHYTVRPQPAEALITLELGGFTLLDLSPGTGTVTGNGFDCDFTPGAVCSKTFPIGTVLTLTATPDVNNNFLWWQARGCADYQNPVCTFTVVSDATVTSYFYLEFYSIAVTMVGDGADGFVEGFMSPGGPGRDIACELVAGVQQGVCTGVQWYGARGVGLTARAMPGSVFVGFSGDCEGGYCEPSPGTAYAVTATFRKE